MQSYRLLKQIHNSKSHGLTHWFDNKAETGSYPVPLSESPGRAVTQWKSWGGQKTFQDFSEF